MHALLRRFWNDDAAALLTVEWLFLVTIMVVGLITGLAIIRNSMVAELEEVGGSILSLNQSFSFTGLRITSRDRGSDNGGGDTGDFRSIAHTAGSVFIERRKTVAVARNVPAVTNIRGAEGLGEPTN
jgi:hypothetical protein